MKYLPYRATTVTGTVIEVAFPLHPDTASAVVVGQLLDSLLHTLSRDIALLPNVANGDVLQALAMALAVRAGIIHTPFGPTAAETQKLLDSALAAMAVAERSGPAPGHA
jgi:hypothetical protein